MESNTLLCNSNSDKTEAILYTGVAIILLYMECVQHADVCMCNLGTVYWM